MNPILIIVLALFVVLMVAFGRNPVEEAHEKRAAALAGKDPLIEAIEEHNKLQGGGTVMQNTPYNPGYNQGYNQINTGMPNNNGFPSYLQQRGGNPYANANPYRTQQMPVTATPAPDQNSYYPPPPLPANSSLPPHSDIRMDKAVPYLNLSGDDGMHLAGGQKIGFVGTKAYTVDAHGKPVPLPDGKYAMYDGRVTITIRNGHKVAD